VKDATPSLQTPLFRQGLEAQSLIFSEQSSPPKPFKQSHVKDATPSLQVPLFWHGMEAQSSIFSEQVLPAKPLEQLQRKDAPSFLQIPLFWHGLGSQLSMSVLGPFVVNGSLPLPSFAVGEMVLVASPPGGSGLHANPNPATHSSRKRE